MSDAADKSDTKVCLIHWFHCLPWLWSENNHDGKGRDDPFRAWRATVELSNRFPAALAPISTDGVQRLVALTRWRLLLALRGVVALAECKKAGLSAVCNFNGVDVRWSAPRPHPPLPKRERERERDRERERVRARACVKERKRQSERGMGWGMCVCVRACVCVCVQLSRPVVRRCVRAGSNRALWRAS